MLTMHQLEVFVVVADEMSVRRAAERLVVTQPAVSATLAALRREVGVDLLVRNGRGIALTDAGTTMYRYAQRVLGLIDEAIDATNAASSRHDRPVRIATSGSLVSTVVAPILARLRATQPELSFTLSVGNRNEVWRMLAAHAADLGLTTRPPSNRGFETLATMPNSVVLVARPGSVFADHLGQTTWIVREEGAGLRSIADEVITRLHLDPRTIVIGSDDALIGSLEAGLGVGLLPRSAVADAVRTRRLCVIPTPVTPIERPWHLIARCGDVLDERVAGFAVDMVLADDRFEWVHRPT